MKNEVDYKVDGTDHIIETSIDKKREIQELRESMGMNRREFCEYYDIPYRTVQDWEAGKRQMPDYVLRLMQYKAKMEKKIDKES